MRGVVYTYADSQHVPEWRPSSEQTRQFDWILFTNDRSITLEGWDVRSLTFSPEIGHYRTTRIPKLLPHRFLESYDFSIYVDANVAPQISWLSNIDKRMGSKVIGLAPRGYTVRHEFKKVAERRYDDLATIERQYAAYLDSPGSLLDLGVRWGGCIVRRHLDHECIKFGERWFENVLRFSRRDQLSLPIALQEIEPSRILSLTGPTNSFVDFFPKPVKTDEYRLGEKTVKLAPRSLLARQTYLEQEVIFLRKALTKIFSRRSS